MSIRTAVCATVLMSTLMACGGGGGDSGTTATLEDDSAPVTAVQEEPQSAGDEQAGDGVSTDGVLCDYSDVTFNSQESLSYTSESSWTCSEQRMLEANGIPDHEVGSFPNPGNPNVITEQSVSAAFTLLPVLTDQRTELGGPRGPVGYVLNGIKIDAATAGSCDDSGTSCSLVGSQNGSWEIEALGQSHFDFGVDFNNAHVQPDGAYHYHGMPEAFLAKVGADGTVMTLIGWATDGFPIYARYGYSDALDASSSLVVVQGSYQLVSDLPANRPSTDVYDLGTFRDDWEYVEGSGDLDECNGRFGVTPEFPDGIYHYFATDSYPFFQRCVRGSL